MGLTIIAVLIIILAFLISLLYLRYLRQRNKIVAKRRWIEQLPSLISTLGVIGTFLGITIGLIKFDTEHLDDSIPLLLDGLKTAFFTSLAGMFGSLILSKKISTIFDKIDGGVSDANIAAGLIVNAVNNMSTTIQNIFTNIQQQSLVQNQNQTTFYTNVQQSLQNVQQSILQISNDVASLILQSQNQTQSLQNLIPSISSIGKDVQNQNATVLNIQQSLNVLNDLNRNIAEMTDILSTMSSTQGDISTEVNSFGEKLHAEVVEIEDKMQETNLLLTNKFDVFTELLKKSNTEALVEVMKKVTEEFQKQMNDLISKLVQENFEQLNKSVESLNIWQQENKEMIISLTKQYKEMSINFETTSTTLLNVGNNTKELIKDDGKLQQIVKSLSKILIEDGKFVEITTKLSDVVELTKSNMQQFDESTNKLNEWVKKQRNFVDGVRLLIDKLEEINKIKDYNEQFWKGTKRSLEDGVGIIKQGAQTLNEQLTNLDKQFYSRLSATLAELDTCIQAMVNGNTTNNKNIRG